MAESNKYFRSMIQKPMCKIPQPVLASEMSDVLLYSLYGETLEITRIETINPSYGTIKIQLVYQYIAFYCIIERETIDPSNISIKIQLVYQYLPERMKYT